MAANFQTSMWFFCGNNDADDDNNDGGGGGISSLVGGWVYCVWGEFNAKKTDFPNKQKQKFVVHVRK